MESVHIALFLVTYVSILLFLILSVVYISTLFFSAYYKVPFVGSKRHQIREILLHIDPQPGSIFYDLGSGDGRVVLEAADYFKLNATGFEINPVLVFLSRVRAHHARSEALFVRADITSVELSKAEIIYVFLLPFMLAALAPTIKSQCSKGTIIISHGFKIHALSSKLYKTRDAQPFSTYYYRL